MTPHPDQGSYSEEMTSEEPSSPRRRAGRDPGVPEHSSGQDHSRAGRAPDVRRRPPTRARAAARGDGAAGRGLPAVLHPPRTWRRHRCVRKCHRRHRPCPQARPGRAGPPARPAPDRGCTDPVAAAPRTASERVRPTIQRLVDGMPRSQQSSSTDVSTCSRPPSGRRARPSLRVAARRVGHEHQPGHLPPEPGSPTEDARRSSAAE